jgi:transcriptional regulator with XRE-family HTH domain
MNNLGKRIQVLRKEQSISQAELAGLAGISKSQINRYENKGIQPQADILNKIAEILKTSVDYLINGDSGEQAKNTLKNVTLLQKFKELEQLPEREQSVMIDVISAYLRDFKAKQAYMI